jgi:hypothetical protein
MYIYKKENLKFNKTSTSALPFGVKIIDKKVLIPEKYIIVVSNYVWMQKSFCKPPMQW